MTTFDEDIKCGAIVDAYEDDAFPCSTPSRYLVERSDGDKSFGENGGSAEACEKHLAETVAGMVDGDAEVRAIVTIRWDKDETEPLCAETDCRCSGCPCDTDAGDGLCRCCRDGRHNGSCDCTCTGLED